MSDATVSTSSPLTLKELCNVNDVLIPLAASERPLEAGIDAHLSRTGGRVRQALDGLQRQLVRGVPLDQAIGNSDGLFSQSFQQIVHAGLSCGRLASVLQLFTAHVLSLIEIRQQINRSLVYPVVVAITAYLLFLGTLNIVFLRMEEFYDDFGMHMPWVLQMLHELRVTSLYWFWIPPLLLVIAITWWARFNDGRFLRTSASPLWRYIPGIRPVLENYKRANFARLLSVMMEEQIPYHQALTLTAQAMGDDELFKMFSSDSGLQTLDNEQLKRELSPYLAWIIIHGSDSSSTASTLKGAAELYQERANRRLLWFQLFMPMILLGVIGGLAVFLYALTVFVPMTNSYGNLTKFS